MSQTVNGFTRRRMAAIVRRYAMALRDRSWAGGTNVESSAEIEKEFQKAQKQISDALDAVFGVRPEEELWKSP